MSERRNELAPLIRTKLQSPLISGDWVARPRLLRHLDRGLGQKLTLVSAPAGYGKTTLICAWLDTKRTAYAWLTLDPSDNDLVTFLSYFIAAVHTVAPNACAGTQSLLYASQRPPSDYLRDSVISELAALTEPVRLILDGYDVIQQNDIQQGHLSRYCRVGLSQFGHGNQASEVRITFREIER
jgi:LuxR family maltose regulon positive regulatory protein